MRIAAIIALFGLAGVFGAVAAVLVIAYQTSRSFPPAGHARDMMLLDFLSWFVPSTLVAALSIGWAITLWNWPE